MSVLQDMMGESPTPSAKPQKAETDVEEIKPQTLREKLAANRKKYGR